MNADAWIISEDIPKSINGGQYNFVNSHDTNKDGDMDIVANCEEYHDKDRV